MIEHHIKADEQKSDIWYYFKCGCAFEAVGGVRAMCDLHANAEEIRAMLYEWLHEGRFLVANCDEYNDIVERTRAILEATKQGKE